MADQREVIDYENLVREYNDSLNSVLRGFRPKYDFLELWVPDTNHTRSIKNLVESAVGAGHSSFSLFFSSTILKDLDLSALVKDLSRYGALEQVTQPGGTTLHLNRAQGVSAGKGSKLDQIDPLYKAQIVKLSDSPAHQGSILEDGDNLLIRSNVEGTSLFAAVDTSTHTIHRARFSGTTDAVQSALLEGLCALIEGVPIQEAHDHSILQLEMSLRDKAQKAGVPGIVNRFNFPPMFELPLLLVRELFATYIKKTGYRPGDNMFERPVSNEWKALPEADKATAISRIFAKLLSEPGSAYHNAAIELFVLKIDLHTKVTVGLRGKIDPNIRAKLYMDIEKAARRELEPRLEFFSHNVKDRNEIRRMN